MGVIYKLRPEIRDFILGQKKTNPILSCRRLTLLIENKFQLKLSKSSINSIIKEAGLSMPIGRRPARRKRRQEPPLKLKLIEFKAEAPPEIKAEVPPEPVVEQPIVKQPVAMPVEPQPEIHIESPSEMQCTGAILLKAADYLIGGSYSITEAIRDRLNTQKNDLLAKTESLIYLSLFEKDLAGLWALVDKGLSLEDVLSYLNELQSVRTIGSDMFRIIPHALQEVRCIKIDCLDKNIFYLDGQMHTVWSTPYLSYDFSATIYNTKSYINKYFFKERPIILFMAPGYDIPTKELFNFILSLDSSEKKIARLTLYGSKLEELETIPLEQAKRRFFVFGLWPWQFVEYRQVKKIGEFKPFYFEALQKDFYAAEIEIELSQPVVKQSVTLTGTALKTTLNEKTRLVILSNLPTEAAKPEELANIYLSHWPNLEEAFQDFSRKIELSTYTGNSQRFPSAQSLNLNMGAGEDIKMLFNQYLKALDLYVRWRFLPLGYEDKDFPTINERFYSLKAVLKKEKDYILATFRPPSGYPFLKDLEYALRRINEKEVVFADGKRLWCSIEKTLS